MEKIQGFSFGGQPATLQAGDQMSYDPVDKAVSFHRMNAAGPSDKTLWMNGDDKFPLSNIRNKGEFWDLAMLIGVLHGLQCTPVEEKIGPVPLFWVTFFR